MMKWVVIQTNFMRLQEPQRHDCNIKTFPRYKRANTESTADGLLNDMWVFNCSHVDWSGSLNTVSN